MTANTDAADAEARQQRLDAVRQVFAALPMIAAMKQAMADATGLPDWRRLRPPLVPLSPAQRETLRSLQNIILVGGGAFLFRKAVKAAFPRHRIHEVKEPMFANVRGFQLAGQNYARSVMTGERDRATTEHGGAA